jgi:hypothetical protein
MNEIFLATWKDVLMLGYQSPSGASMGGLKGQVPFVIDWFLPNSLGGYGLEETSGKGVRASSLGARRLARYLMDHPEEHLPYLPSLGEQPRFALEVADRYRKELDTLKSSALMVPKRDPCPSGYLEEASLVSRITNEALMEANGNVFLGTGKRYRGGDFITDRDKDVALAIGLEKLYRTRSRYWRGNLKRAWSNGPPLTQRELNSYVPMRRVLHLVPQLRLLAYLGTEEDATFPIVNEALRGACWSEQRTLKSGSMFPANRRYDPQVITDLQSIDVTPILPFSWPEYTTTTWAEFGVLARSRGRELAQKKELESHIIGPIARAEGIDIFGDSEFDQLLDQFSVPQ